MSPFFGSNDENAARWRLPVVAELLDEGEILCDLEGADCAGVGIGLLVVTDLRVLFVQRAVFGREVHVVSVRLEDVVSAETFESDSFLRRQNLGALAISRRRSLGDWATQPHDAVIDVLGQFAGLLEEGETLCDAEKAVSLGWRSGVLVVTDRRVAFFMGGVLWRRRCVVSASYAEIAGVDVLDSPHGTKWAVVVVATLTELWSDWQLKFSLSARRPRADEIASMIQLQKQLESSAHDQGAGSVDLPDSWSDRIEFEAIKGGRPRAEEITSTIVRQKRLLLERGADSASGKVDRAPTADEASPNRTRSARCLACQSDEAFPRGLKPVVVGSTFGESPSAARSIGWKRVCNAQRASSSSRATRSPSSSCMWKTG